MKDIKLLVSSILIFISFFVGYIFGDKKNLAEIEKYKGQKHYLNLEVKKTKIDIDKPENIIIKINGVETNSGSIDIK